MEARTCAPESDQEGPTVSRGFSTARVRRRFRRRGVEAVAGLAALALLLTGCTGGGLPDDPQEAVATAFENTFEGGTGISASLQVSDRVREQELDDERTRRVVEALGAEDAVRVALRSGEFGLAVALGDGQPLQVRRLSDAFYVLVDVPALVEFLRADVDVEELRGQVGQFSILLGDLAVFAEAAVNGDWVGVSEVPEDAGEQLRGALGATEAPTVDPDEAEQAASELGLTDPRAFVERYLEVEEAGEGTYTATLRLRALVRATSDKADELGTGAVAPSDQELQDVPETVSGVTIQTEGEQVSAVEVDLAPIVTAAEDRDAVPSDLQEGDAVLRLAFGEPDGALLEAPEDAETVPFQDVVDTLGRFGAMLQGFGQQQPGGGGGAPGGPVAPTELPSGLEVPQDLQSPS